MPYYSAGDYYRGDYYRGDNYRARGDFLGIGGALKKAGGAVLKGVKAVTGVVSHTGIPVVSQLAGVANKIISIASSPTITTNGPSPYITPASSGFSDIRSVAPPDPRPEAGVTGAIHRMMPGGYTGYYKSRHMNVTNVKALRRAGRRVKGFLRIAQRLGALPVNRGKGKRLFKRKTR